MYIYMSWIFLFRRDRRLPDGFLNKCKACLNRKDAERARQRKSTTSAPGACRRRMGDSQ